MDIDSWIEDQSVVSDILNVEDFEEFLRKHWEKAPTRVSSAERRALAYRNGSGDCARFIRDLLTVREAEQLVHEAAGAADITLSIVDDFIARPLPGGLGDPKRLAAAFDAFARGSTLLLPGLHHRNRRFRNLCRQFDNAMLSHGLPLVQATSANAYLTPANLQGFGIHYDHHCVVVLQLAGSKLWTIYAPTVPLPTARCTNIIPPGELADVVMTVRMEPGDVLYIPRGFPHFAQSQDDLSMHVTLGLFAVTWSDLIKSLAADLPAFRGAVRPWTDDQDTAAQHYRSRLIEALEQTDPTDALSRQLAESLSNLPPLPRDRLLSMSKSPHLRPSSVLSRTSLLLAMVQIEHDQAVLRFPGGKIALPVELMPSLEFVAETENFRLSDLPMEGADLDRAELARLLIRHGVLTVEALHDGTLPQDLKETVHGYA